MTRTWNHNSIGLAALDEFFLRKHVGGGDTWPLTQRVADAGMTLKSLTGQYLATVSNTVYYNQVTVSGALSPDATGTYSVVGVVNGYPYYVLNIAGTNWYCSWGLFYGAYRYGLSVKIGGDNSSNYWRGISAGVAPPATNYLPVAPATGIATVANVTASGVYRTDLLGVTLGSTGPTLCGEPANAAAFDGSAGHAYSTYAPITLAGAWTLSAWLKAAGNATSGAALSTTRTDSTLTWLGFSNNLTKLLVYLRNAAGTQILNVSSNAVVFDNTWHHVAFRNNNGAAVLYVDGVADTANFNFTPAGTFAPTITTIGAVKSTTVGNYFPGSLAYVSLSPEALGAADIKTEFLLGAKGSY